jgi:apoptosis-inducing factor 2
MRKKVVVIGGGFAGSHVAKHLEKKFSVTLIDEDDYFEFTPGILRTIVEPSHISKIQVLHTHYLSRAKVVVGKVSEVGKSYVKVGKKKIEFNYLAICSGSSYNLPIKEQGVVTATRARHLRSCYEDLCKAKRILIIGGGLVGVELAGEIFYRYGKEKKISIVHAGKRLIERNSEKASNYAEKFLKSKGAEIIYGERIVKKSGEEYVTNKDRKVEADMAFVCTGIKPNYDFMKAKMSSVLNKENHIVVNSCLQVRGMKNVFAAGDVSGVVEEKTAQNAERQGQVVYKNICALEFGGDLREYSPRSTPLVISLGKWDGLYCGKHFTFSGIVPAMMKWGVERWEMGKKRRVM